MQVISRKTRREEKYCDLHALPDFFLEVTLVLLGDVEVTSAWRPLVSLSGVSVSMGGSDPKGSSPSLSGSLSPGVDVVLCVISGVAFWLVVTVTGTSLEVPSRTQVVLYRESFPSSRIHIALILILHLKGLTLLKLAFSCLREAMRQMVLFTWSIQTPVRKATSLKSGTFCSQVHSRSSLYRPWLLVNIKAPSCRHIFLASL